MAHADQDLESWAADLPYPLAAVLWTYVGERDSRARFDASIHFFEVAVRFIAVLLLSGLRTDRQAYVEARRSWQGIGPIPSVVMSRSSMGSWARLSSDVSKALRRMIHTQPTLVAEWFGLATAEPVAALTSRATANVIGEAVRCRNEWRGHDSAITRAERSARVSSMGDLIRALRACLLGALDEWELLWPHSLQSASGETTIDAHVLDGPNPRLRSRDFIVDHPVDTDALYVSWRGARRALRLIPLIRAEQPPDSADAAVYFFDRLDNQESRWLSYDSASHPDVRLKVEPWLLDLLHDLDEPSVAPSSAEPEKTNPQGETDRRSAGVAPGSDRGPLKERIIEGIRDWLPQASLVERGDRTDVRTSRRIGWLSDSNGVVRVLAHQPIERAVVVPGTQLMEIPVTSDDRPGVELTVEEFSQASVAVALMMQANAASFDRPTSADWAVHQLASVLGPEWLPCFGNGLWPPTDLSRFEQNELWHFLDVHASEDPRLKDHRRAHSPGAMHVRPAPNIDVSIRLSRVATSVVAEWTTSPPPGLIEKLRHLDRGRPNGASVFAVQRRVNSILAFDVVGPQLTTDRSDQAIEAVWVRLERVMSLVRDTDGVAK